MTKRFIIASRRSPLALAQSKQVAEYLLGQCPGASCEILEKVTTGDKQQAWSLEARGGKGLFTKELEDALLSGEANVAMHSAKDLPTELPDGLTIAGYLPRDLVGDMLILRDGVEAPKIIATGSPRRRAQIRAVFPEAEFVEIRGNVQTRLQKMADGYADATIMACAGLKRLGIEQFPGLRFIPLTMEEMVPAVGQGAIAVECCGDFATQIRHLFDERTYQQVHTERLFLQMLGGGCHVAYAVHFNEGMIHVFHESCGYRKLEFEYIEDESLLREAIAWTIKELGLRVVG